MFHSLDNTTTHRFSKAINYEWLETNGLGGYACSTIIGTHTRKYHGLLVAALKPPVGRKILLSKLDEAVISDGKRCDLGANKYGGAVHPNGYIFQQRFEKGIFPSFYYKSCGAEIKKTIVAVHGENTTLVLYEVLNAATTFTMELLPLMHPRGIHEVRHMDPTLSNQADFKHSILTYQAKENEPQVYISVPNSSYTPSPDWYFNFEYPVEKSRGMEAHEDLFSPGKLYVNLKEGDKLGVVISTDHPGQKNAWSLFEKEKKRRLALLEKAGTKDPMLAPLVLAADQFIVQRGEAGKSVIAGYPWFTDWGRDTMIALPGLCLATGRFEEARLILESFAENIEQGMIPNRFPDESNEPEYNTLDASLWFFVAAYKYVKATVDIEFVQEILLPVMEEILDWHEKGTQFNIIADEDGLLCGGEPGVQLTWMDAKAGDWVVTPRMGKAVEINALWYNAWKIYTSLLKMVGENCKVEVLTTKTKKIKRSFMSLFWNEEENCLYDYIEGEYKDATIRPNQLFAISLPFPLLTRTRAQYVLDRVESELYTPLGMRSLTPADQGYKPNYGGDQMSRDGAYHQGTAWTWLLGPYFDALIYTRSTLGKEMVRRLMRRIEPHLREACIGSISEIFDGDAPYHPRGCIAQAWSVSELLRVSYEYELSDLVKKVPARGKKRRRPAQARSVREHLLPTAQRI